MAKGTFTQDAVRCHALLHGTATHCTATLLVRDRGKMLVSDLERKLTESEREGHRPFLVVATAGTTVLGAAGTKVLGGRYGRYDGPWSIRRPQQHC